MRLVLLQETDTTTLGACTAPRLSGSISQRARCGHVRYVPPQSRPPPPPLIFSYFTTTHPHFPALFSYGAPRDGLHCGRHLSSPAPPIFLVDR